MHYTEFSQLVKKKYPVYENVDDKTLAQKVVEKYPVYASKVDFEEPKGTVIDAFKQISAVPTQIFSPKGLQQIAQHPADIPTQFATAYANQALLGLPQSLLQKYGKTFPEPVTPAGRAAELIGGTAGFFTGAPGKIAVKAGSLAEKGVSKILQNPTFLSKLATKGIGGATGGAAIGAATTDTNPEGDILQLTQRGNRALTGAGIGLGLGMTGSAAKSIAGGIAKGIRKHFAGITDESVATIKRLGADKVFSPEKMEPTYIGEYVVPDVQKRIAKSITNPSKIGDVTLNKLGLKNEDIQTLKTIGPQEKNLLADIVRGNVSDVDQAIASRSQIADSAYSKMFKRLPEGPVFDVTDATQGLGSQLKSRKWMTPEELPSKSITGVENANKNALVNAYNNLKSKADADGKIRISKQDYANLKQDFNMKLMNETDPISAGVAKKAVMDFRDDIGKQYPSLKAANKIYRDASVVDELSKSIKKLGTQDVTKTLPENLETKLHQISRNNKVQFTKQWEPILGKETMDNLAAHEAAQNFTNQERGWPNITGLTRLGLIGIAKKYYQSEPSINALLSKNPSSTGAISELMRRAAESYKGNTNADSQSR